MKIIQSIRLSVVFLFPVALVAQGADTTAVAVPSKLERAAFESTSLIESQSSVLNTKGTLELTMNHRFGIVNSGPQSNDFFGIWAPSNIRLALDYAIFDRLTVGFATIKDDRLQDFSMKAALLRQTRDGKMPLSITYFGNATMDGRPSALFLHPSDRWSFYNQLIFARRFSSNFSLQIAPSIGHMNYVEAPVENNIIAVELGGRIKITPTMSFLFDYNQPITTYFKENTKPGMGAGFEFSTGSHAFQLFVTNYKTLSEQHNVLTNQNDFFDGKYLIGFNITRLWHL